MELFFQRVIDLFKCDSDVKAALESSCSSNDIAEMKKPSPKMTAVNRVLAIEECRCAVWKALGLDLSVPLPALDAERLLYGSVSDIVHDPGLQNVYVANSCHKDFKSFIAVICGLFKSEMVEFDTDKAVIGKDLF